MSEIQKTSESVQDYLCGAARSQWLGIFDNVSLAEVRREFFNRVQPSDDLADCCRLNQSELIAWIESRITVFKEAGDILWLDMLRWYVMKSYNNEPFVISSVEFAIKLVLAEENWTHKNEMIKLIFAKMNDELVFLPLYWEAPSMERFLSHLLGPVDDSRLSFYAEEDWINVERAVNRIMKEKDILWRLRLLAIHNRLASGASLPAINSDFALADHKAFLWARIGFFEEKASEIGLRTLTLARQIARRAGINESNIRVNLKYERDWIAGKKMRVRLHFDYHSRYEKKIQEALEGFVVDCSLRYDVWGFTPDANSFGFRGPWKGNTASWSIWVTPSLGSNRLRIPIRYGNEDFTLIVYVRGFEEAELPRKAATTTI